MLTNITKIGPAEYIDALNYCISKGKNLLIFGYAGIGKTLIAQDCISKSNYEHVYMNLSVLEAPDLNGIPVNRKNYVEFNPPRFLVDHKDPYVLLVDELDKAKIETQNPMLELFQFRKINGRAMPIHAVIATGNHPEEYAGQNIINHALTNRCMIFQLEVKTEEWLSWASANNIHDLILSYLSKNPNKLIEPPNKDDVTAYCRATPRSWTNGSEDLNDYLAMKPNATIEDQVRILSARVGEATALELELWFKYYSELDTVIDKLVDAGITPDIGDSIEKQYMVAISSLRRMMHITTKAKRLRSAKYVGKWIQTITPDIRLASLKTTIDSHAMINLNLAECKEFLAAVKSANKISGFDTSKVLVPNVSGS